MQYAITLPADYDMNIIRNRVAAGGHALDDRAGLGLKAYAVRERANNSPVNEYAPFYLWNDVGAMSRFLVGGGGFQNIIRDFGRPAVRHWTGVAFNFGPARDTIPTKATRRLSAASPKPNADSGGLGLSALIEQEVDSLHRVADGDGVHSAALAVDPHSWQLMRFVLWAEGATPDDDATERYDVLHLSAPEMGRLPKGGSW